MKNINKIRKICVAGIVLIFVINTFLSTVGALSINIVNFKSIGNQLSLNKEFIAMEEPLADVWNVTLQFNEPGGTFDNAFFGEKTDASDGLDGYDVPKTTPGMPPYIRAWFATNFPVPHNQLWEEYKHYPDSSKQWNLSIQWVPTDYATPTTITISWNTAEVGNSEYNIVKLCNSGGSQLKNMLTESSYSFTCPAVTPQIFYIICQANNTVPNQPSNPSPSNGSAHVDVNTNLGWTCSDPDGDPLTYDIYFGTSSNPPLIQSNWPTNSYDPGTMNNNTTYYWRIVAKDNQGGSTSGPIWHFSTNYAPNTPSSPSPINGTTNIDINANLGWICSDPDGDPLTYDIYFGTSSNPPLIQSNWATTSYDPGTMSYSTLYYWKIVAKDDQGASTTGPIWHFTTEPNTPPNTPSNPNPPNNATDVDVNIDLSWTCTDPDGDPLTYDIYFGTNSNPPQIQNNWSSNTYDPGTMNNNTTYYWKIVAWDGSGTSASGPVWDFTTAQNNAPNTPSDPNPPDNATDVDVNADLSWNCSDPDGDPVTYDIYFGTSSNPPLVQSNQSSTTYDPATMNNNTTYYWKIVAWDSFGNSAVGPIWNFTTGQQINQPPYIPANPTPVDGSTNVDVNTNLKWDGGDPDGDPVTYDVYFSKTYPPQQVASNYPNVLYDPGTLDFNTIYYWKIVAWDNNSASTNGPIWSFTTSNKTNRPPTRPTIQSILGILVPNRVYDYNFTSSDPDVDDVFYYIDWGDATYEDWSGPHTSGETIIIGHTWPPKTSIYQIKAKAKDTYGSESDWGTLLVFVLSPRNSDHSLLLRIIQRFPILQRIIMILPLFNTMTKLKQ